MREIALFGIRYLYSYYLLLDYFLEEITKSEVDEKVLGDIL